MPIEFESLSHGPVAFGFFNIYSDMLLLEHYFFFANEFCKIILRAAESSDRDDFTVLWRIYHIARREDIGDLMGAIRGIRFVGFIGETYQYYPFPERREDFKQRANGDQTRGEFRKIIEKYASQIDIEFCADRGKREVSIGDYRFTLQWFHRLIEYVWAGGLPRWEAERRPDYILLMKEKLKDSSHWLFKGLKLT